MANSYVSPTGGASTQDGLSADTAYPFSSIASAESDAGTGGIVYFVDGTYTISSSSTFLTDPGITYKSLTRHGAKFTTTNLAGGHTIYFGQTSATGASQIVDGLVFENLRFGIYANVKPTIQFCKFESNADLSMGEYIFVNGGSAGYNFYNNSITTSFTGTVNLFYLSQSSSFERNSFHFGNSNATSLGANLPTSGMKNNIWMTTDASKSSLNIASASSYSCFFQAGSSNTSGGSNNLFAQDPQFVDPTNGDLRLRPNSPCINAGTAS